MCKLKGMGPQSTGYCRKNFSLFLSDVFDGFGTSVSGGGSGARRGYSYELNGHRLGKNSQENMSVLLRRDLQIVRSQWSKQNLGERAWKLLTDREDEVRAPDVTAWRCRVDK